MLSHIRHPNAFRPIVGNKPISSDPTAKPNRMCGAGQCGMRAGGSLKLDKLHRASVRVTDPGSLPKPPPPYNVHYIGLRVCCAHRHNNCPRNVVGSCILLSLQHSAAHYTVGIVNHMRSFRWTHLARRRMFAKKPQ